MTPDAFTYALKGAWDGPCAAVRLQSQLLSG